LVFNHAIPSLHPGDPVTRGAPVIEFHDAKRIAAMLAAVGEPTRLQILYRLAQGPHHVGKLAGLIGIPMVNMSHHLGVMRQAGLLDDEKDGRRVVYRIHPDICSHAGNGSLATLQLGRYKLTVMKGGGVVAKPRKGKARR
jgi:DNA-binding transcriptional ArsR family regulator